VAARAIPPAAPASAAPPATSGSLTLLVSFFGREPFELLFGAVAFGFALFAFDVFGLAVFDFAEVDLDLDDFDFVLV
jgi:hypothetical protein